MINFISIIKNQSQKLQLNCANKRLILFKNQLNIFTRTYDLTLIL